MRLYGFRWLLVDCDLIKSNMDKIKENTFIEDVLVSYVNDEIDTVFLMNNEKYKRIYEALSSNYNPLWNVDGEETVTYIKGNSGTVKNDEHNTGTITDT